MVRAIGEINDANTQIMTAIETSNHEIGEIVTIITEIGNKTKVINDIVFQTKLLSFNASVEAARAGEHGKGFAVVAEEVGNLAQMSGNAAKEISALLDGSTEKVQQTVSSTKSKVEGLIALGKQKVESGTEVAKRCGLVLNEIVGGAQEVTKMVDEIAHASGEQSKGIHEVNRAVEQLDQTTQQNASASEQAASAAEQLSSQAQTLRSSVEELLHTVNGARAQASAFDHDPKTENGGRLSVVSRATHKTVSEPAKLSSKPVKSKVHAPVLKSQTPPRSAPPSPSTRTSISSVSQSEELSGSEIPSENDQRFKDIA
jgi:methyl-accepting chemotaxis protein